MSIFKTTGIILKIEKQKENDFLLDIFTYDYGKIKLYIKKNKIKKNIDLGFIINFEINVKKENSINEIRNIKIKNEFNYLNQEYKIIFQYLEILKLILEKCPLNMPIYEIFNLLNELNNLKNISEEKLIFSKIKLFAILGILKVENNNPKIQKILSFISKESVKNILKLKGLDEKTKKELNLLFK